MKMFVAGEWRDVCDCGAYGGPESHAIWCQHSERKSHLEMAENIAQCEALQADAQELLAEVTACLLQNSAILAQYEATSGQAIQPEHPTSADTPRGLVRVATDGERNGRLAWVPGAR